MSKYEFLSAEKNTEISYDIENLDGYKKCGKKECMIPLSKLIYFDLDYLNGFFKRLNRLANQKEFNDDRVIGIGFTKFKNKNKYDQVLSVAYKKNDKIKYAVIAPRWRNISLKEMEE